MYPRIEYHDDALVAAAANEPPESLAKLILRMMSKQPAERGESAAEVGTALQAIVDGLLAK